MFTTRWRLLLSRLFMAGLIGVFVFGSSFWNSHHPMIQTAFRLTGTVLIAFGMLGRLWSLAHIAGRKRQTLVMTGPYSVCRNPLYFSSMLLAIGLGFCACSFVVPAAILIGFCLYYPSAIKREERGLREVFGEQFDIYMQTVPRLIPSFRHFVDEPEVAIRSTPFIKGAIEIVSFVPLITIAEAIDLSHRAGILPSYFWIY